MSIEFARDLVIVIWGIVGIIVLIILAVLMLSLYSRLRTILDMAKTTVGTVREMTFYVRDQVVEPLVKLAAVIQGVSAGVGVLVDFIRGRIHREPPPPPSEQQKKEEAAT